MTSPDTEVERLQREYEAACIKLVENLTDAEILCTPLAMKAEIARVLLQEARQRAAQQHSDEEIITQIFSHFGPSARIEQPSLRTPGATYIIYPDDIRQALSALRAAGFEIRRRP